MKQFPKLLLLLDVGKLLENLRLINISTLYIEFFLQTVKYFIINKFGRASAICSFIYIVYIHILKTTVPFNCYHNIFKIPKINLG